jgi:hypothetical protein
MEEFRRFGSYYHQSPRMTTKKMVSETMDLLGHTQAANRQRIIQQKHLF